MRTWLILIVASLLSISGCATIVSGTTQSVTIQSTPAGASVFIDGVEKGVTPLTLELKRKEDTTLKVSKEGYQDVTMPLPTKFNSMFWGNIIIGGLFGSSTDAGTGATKEYVPDVHLITLVAE